MQSLCYAALCTELRLCLYYTVHVTNSVTLSLQCADGKVEALSEALQATVGSWRGRFPNPLPLELYTSSNFIGLFVEEQVAEVLKDFAADFATEAATKAGILDLCIGQYV